MRNEWTDGEPIQTDANGIIDLPMERPGYYKVDDEKWVLFSRGMTVCVCGHEYSGHGGAGCLGCYADAPTDPSCWHEFKEMYLTSHPDVEASANHAG